mmetsp:Transcript_74326/g.215402  ORF Transcript_74326/g.215402 Transcript_74326/m.215402 type:complete len:265 (-) Transcript_74326:473-1267(-)
MARLAGLGRRLRPHLPFRDLLAGAQLGLARVYLRRVQMVARVRCDDGRPGGRRGRHVHVGLNFEAGVLDRQAKLLLRSLAGRPAGQGRAAASSVEIVLVLRVDDDDQRCSRWHPDVDLVSVSVGCAIVWLRGDLARGIRRFQLSRAGRGIVRDSVDVLLHVLSVSRRRGLLNGRWPPRGLVAGRALRVGLLHRLLLCGCFHDLRLVQCDREYLRRQHLRGRQVQRVAPEAGAAHKSENVRREGAELGGPDCPGARKAGLVASGN